MRARTGLRVSILGLPVRVQLASVEQSKKALTDAAEQLLETATSWSGGLQGLSYAATDTASGSVMLGVHINQFAQWREAAKQASSPSPIVVRGESAVGVTCQ
jgi:hypothetical protein